MTVRLVKGAYWDSEIKRAQERGLASFPVYTSKAATDASYLECARHLFAAGAAIYPQFATHNAYTVAAVLELAPAARRTSSSACMAWARRSTRRRAPKFPRCRRSGCTRRWALTRSCCRTWCGGCSRTAPTAPSCISFMNPQIPVEQVVRDPISSLNAAATRAARVREPHALYGAERANSDGEDFGDPAALAALQAEVQLHAGESYSGGPILSGRVRGCEHAGCFARRHPRDGGAHP